MERFNSTLSTTAAIVCGLVLAAHLRHGAIEEPPRAPGLAVAAAEPWVDPPADLQKADPIARLTDGSPTPVPAVEPAVMHGAVAPILPTGLSAPAPRPQGAAAAQKRRIANRTARIHQASAGREIPDAAAATTSTGREVQRRSRADPIGSLIERLDAERGS